MSLLTMVAASRVPLTGDYPATCIMLAQLSPMLQITRQLHNSALQLSVVGTTAGKMSALAKSLWTDRQLMQLHRV